MSAELAILGILAVLIYLGPMIGAIAIGSSNTVAISIINIFFGWTLLGWGGALALMMFSPTNEDLQKEKDREEKIDRFLENSNAQMEKINE